MQTSFAVAVAGPDPWLRPQLIQRLTAADLTVRDIGAGTSSIRDIEALVYLPVLMPSASPSKDAGTASARMTFAAASEGRVGRVIVVSRVGPDERDPYLDELRAVEANAAHICSKVTVIRTAHPIGAIDDAGPVVDTLRRAPVDVDETQDPLVQPVDVDDLLDVIQAAAEGRIGAGVVEVGGPIKMTLSSLRELIGGAPLAANGRRGWWKRRGGEQATRHLLALDSVPNRKLASPLGAAARDLQANWAG